MEDIKTNPDNINFNGNFIVGVYDICSRMEDKAEKFIKSANEREKDLEEIWKTTNHKKQQKQQELAQNYKVMAYVSTALMVTSMACTASSFVMQTQPGSSDLTKQLADLLNSLGDKGTNFASKTADNLSTHSTQNTNALIEELTQNATKVWEADKRTNETRKEELKNLKEKLNGATRDSLDKTSVAYSVRG